MTEGNPTTTRRAGRVRRQAALRGGAALGAAGAVLAAAAPAAAHTGRRTLHLEVDLIPVDPVSIVRAGSGPPQRGDWFFLHGALYPVGGTAGASNGVYQCFGAWTQAATETSAPDQRLVTVLWNLIGRGWITGLTHEGGANPNAHVGAIQGGTGEFNGALGTFRQVLLEGAVPGVAPGQAVVRGVLDLLLPDAAPGGLPRTGQ
jgi:hypothetical protein